MHMNLETDFSSINHQYLLKVRGFAKKESALVMDIRPKSTKIGIGFHYTNHG